MYKLNIYTYQVNVFKDYQHSEPQAHDTFSVFFFYKFRDIYVIHTRHFPKTIVYFSIYMSYYIFLFFLKKKKKEIYSSSTI